MLRPGDEPIRGYRLESFLGRGQFGEVWKTTAPGGGAAALKFLDLTGKEGRKELRGIQRVKTIRHPHLMPITALWVLNEEGEILSDEALLGIKTESAITNTLAPQDVVEPVDRPRWLVVAQLLGEGTLGDQLARCKEQGEVGIPVADLLNYMEEAAKGIDYLNVERHDLGDGMFAVQHCDIKPDNMLLVGGSVMVCDFGLAHIMFQSAGASRTTGMPGSPAFIAPECIDRTPSPTSDQYSLAVSYCELRTGNLPIVDQTPVGALDAHRSGNLDFSALPEAEAAILAKATALDPQKRYASCLEFVRALQRASSVSSVPKLPVPSSTSWMIPAVAGAVLIGLLFTYVFWPTGKTQPHTFGIVVSPASAELTIDGEQLALTNGKVVVERTSSSSINLVVSSGLDYDVQAQRVAVNDFSETKPLNITLGRSAKYLADQAAELLASGDNQTAAAELSKAISKDKRFATFPQPIVMPSPDEFGAVSSFEVSGEGDCVIVGFTGGVVAKWNFDAIEAGSKPPQKLYQHHSESKKCSIQCIATAGNWVATADNQHQVKMSNLSSPGATSSFSTKNRGRIVLGLTETGDIVLTGCDGKVQRWDRSGNGVFESTLLGTHQERITEPMVITERGESVITGSWDGTVRLWAIGGTARSISLGDIGGEVLAIATTRSDIAFGGTAHGENPRAYVRSLSPDAQPQPLPEAPLSPTLALTFDVSGKLLAAGSEDDGRVSVWNRIGNEQWKRIPLPNRHTASIRALAFSDSNFLVSSGNDGLIVIWDLASGTRKASVLASGLTPPEVDEDACMRFSSDGRWLFMLPMDGRLRAWDFRRCILIKQASDRAETKTRDPDEIPDGVEA